MSVHHHQDAHCQLHLSCQGAHQLNFHTWSWAQHSHTYIYNVVLLVIFKHQPEYHHNHLIFSHHQLQTHQLAHHTSKQYVCGFNNIDWAAHVYQNLVSIGTNVIQVISQVSVNHHCTVVTVIVQSQSHINVTNQLLSTVAILSSLDVHITFLFDASTGNTVAVSCTVPQLYKVELWISNVTDSTAIQVSTAQVSVCHQSTVVQVIVQFHTDTYDTNQLLSTVATEVSLLDQVTSGKLVLDGATVAVSCTGASGKTIMLSLSKDTHVVCTTYVVTLIICVSRLLGMCQVIVHSHTDTGVISQAESTVAILVSELSHITVGFVILVGRIVYNIWYGWSTCMLWVDEDTVNDSGMTSHLKVFNAQIIMIIIHI